MPDISTETPSGILWLPAVGDFIYEFTAQGDPLPEGSRLYFAIGKAPVPALEIDVFVVPGLMFDRAGRRLGRGGGHYDRYLERRRTDATIIGVCFVEHLVDELPEDSWDVVMDLIVTDEIVVWCSRHGADQ